MGARRVWGWLRGLFRVEEPRPESPAARQASARGPVAGASRTEPGPSTGRLHRDVARGRRVSSAGSEAPPAGPTPTRTSSAGRGVSPPQEGHAPAEIPRAAAVGPGEQTDRESAGRSAAGSPRARLTPASGGRGAVDLVIGLDFGTAATKVVIRSPWLPGQRAAAVAFGELGHSSSPYLLPTRLRIGADGKLTLRGDVAGEWVTDLKVHLLERAPSQEATADEDDAIGRAAAYLALTLREARARFLTAERETYGRFEVRWALNLGIPSAGYDDELIRGRFLRVARVAWWLSGGSEPPTWDSVTEALRQEPLATFNSGIAIEVVPEVAAQAVGYARSTLRDPGLHLLVDVGASTFDVCGFVLHEREGQDRYELFTATVDRLGVLELHRARLAVLGCLTGSDGDECVAYDPLMPVKETLDDYHPGCSCTPPDVDAEFCRRATGVVMRHLIDLKRRRDPLSRRWTTGLPVFLCGGGSGMDLFHRLVNDADARFRATTTARGLLLRTLPKPEHLLNDDVGEALFHRLSVAYGLSFDALNIGRVSPPHETEDVPPPPRRRIEDAFISKDQV